MKKVGFIVLIVCCAYSAALAQEKISSNTIPSTIAFTVAEKDLFPEGIAYDSKTKLFFVSSIQKNKVIAVDSKNTCFDFVKQGQDSMFRSLGMKVDVQRRRLWIVSNSDWDDKMMSAVHIYNIDTKKLIKKFFTEKNRIPTFNDLIITKTGAAYISDYGGNSIYHVPADLSKVELFLKSDSLLVGANGMDLSPDNLYLYVASDTQGIVLVDLKSKQIKPISKQIAAESRGIDGLMLYQNSLIAILNGDPDMGKHHIARYQLSADGQTITSASIIDQNNPLFNQPTTGVIVGDELYCLAVTNLRLFGTGIDANSVLLKNLLVLKYCLEKNDL